jgi:CRP-like cAMP-binding protein
MPSSANLRPSLENHPFACNLNREQIASLGACAEECSIARGQYIWHQGEPDEDIYLIFSGQVALEISVPQQGSLQIEMVGEGDVLGWSCLLPPRPSYFDARAITPVHAVRLPGSELRALCERDAALGYQVYKAFSERLAERLEVARLRLLELYEPRRKQSVP